MTTTQNQETFRARGERHGNAKLTADQVRAIRRERAAKKTPFRLLAERFGVSVSTIGQILRRESWTAREVSESSVNQRETFDGPSGPKE